MLAAFISLCSFIPMLYGASEASTISLPRSVQNVELESLDKERMTIPYWGERNILIFYIDPDNQGQNREFTIELKERYGDLSLLENLYAMGIVNLKDAPLVPKGIARSVARKKSVRIEVDVALDTPSGLSGDWGLGDCNNEFVMLLINKECELIYMHKGDLSQEQIDQFYTFIEDYI